MVFSSYGGSSPETERFIKELAEKLAKKQQLEMSVVTSWLRTKISFTLLRSCILCIRGSRSIKKFQIPTDPSNMEPNVAVGQF